MTQILNNVIVSLAPYCAQNFWGDVVLDLKGKSIESRLMSIEILTQTPRFAHTLLVLGRSINKGIREYKSPTPVKFYIRFTFIEDLQ